MTEEKKPGEDNAENNANEEELDNKAEDAKADEAKKSDEKSEEEEDPYVKYLKDLESENEQLKADKASLEEQNRQKAGALKEEREKNKGGQAGSSDEDKPLTKKEVEAMLEKKDRDFQSRIEVDSLTSNENERKVILKIMEVKGVSPKDAYILANAHLVEDSKKRDSESAEEEDLMSRISSGGGNFSGVNKKTSKINQVATEGLTESEKKHLKI